MDHIKKRPGIRFAAYGSNALDETTVFILQDFHNRVPQFAKEPNKFTSFYYRTKYFFHSFLQSVIKEWKKLDPHVRIYVFYSSFHKALLNFISPSEKKICNIHGQVGIKFLIRLRLGFSP